MSSNNSILNGVFTRNTFTDLLANQFNSTYYQVVKRYIEDIGAKNNRILISEIYRIMAHGYRNEYVYKNTLLNELLLGRHNLKTTTALTEIPIRKSIADFILINGRAVVYEIKTELDGFARLECQLSDYYKAFDHVCVVICEDKHDKLQEWLRGRPIGIYVLTKNNRLRLKKEPIRDGSKLDSTVMFKILRKKEFENIIRKHYGKLPAVSQVNYYNQCHKLFKDIDIELSYRYLLRELKKRGIMQIEEYERMPYELKFLAYFAKYKSSDYHRLNDFLDNEFRGWIQCISHTYAGDSMSCWPCES